MNDSDILTEVRKQLTGLLHQNIAPAFNIVEFIDKNREKVDD